MKPYVLTREGLSQLLGDKRTYDLLPELAELQPAYAVCYQAMRSHGGCCGSEIVHMYPVLRSAMLLFAALKADPDFVTRFRNLCELRTGLRNEQFVLHYRESVKGKPQRIAFR